MIGNILKKLKTRKFSEEFGLASDPRVVVVSRVEDFARMQDDKNIMAMTMPNPVSIPTKPAEIEAVLKAIKGKPYRVVMKSEMILPGGQEIDQNLPACIKDTVHLVREAFKYAHRMNVFPDFYIRLNSEYPIKPHAHEQVVGGADIFGSSTVFYKGKLWWWPGPSYSLPTHHITVFRDILHRAGDLDYRTPRLTMMCFIPKLDV